LTACTAGASDDAIETATVGLHSECFNVGSRASLSMLTHAQPVCDMLCKTLNARGLPGRMWSACCDCRTWAVQPEQPSETVKHLLGWEGRNNEHGVDHMLSACTLVLPRTFCPWIFANAHTMLSHPRPLSTGNGSLRFGDPAGFCRMNNRLPSSASFLHRLLWKRVQQGDKARRAQHLVACVKFLVNISFDKPAS
jgi:hypothetical protein